MAKELKQLVVPEFTLIAESATNRLDSFFASRTSMWR